MDEDRIVFEKETDGTLTVTCDGITIGVYYPTEKAIVLSDSEGSSIPLDTLEYIIFLLKNDQQPRKGYQV